MALDLIKPPTDNLYKFAAVFGLILVVVGFVFPPWLFYRSSLEYLKSAAGKDDLAAHQKFAQVRYRVLSERWSQLALERARLQQRLNSLAQSERNSAASSERDKLESAIKEVRREAEALEDAYYELTLSLELKDAQVKQQETFSTNETRNSRFVMVLGWILGFIGLFFAFAGFIMWYLKVQRYQDRILRMQATSRIMAAEAIERAQAEMAEDPE